MSEVSLYAGARRRVQLERSGGVIVVPAALVSSILVQGYLAHQKPPPHRTLQYAYVQGPMVVPGGGLFPLGEVPLYGACHSSLLFGKSTGVPHLQENGTP